MSLFNENIHAEGNPYGFQININHPKVRDKYNRFKVWKGVPRAVPLADDERLEFERYLLKKENSG